jgi:hypothetical protein
MPDMAALAPVHSQAPVWLSQGSLHNLTGLSLMPHNNPFLLSTRKLELREVR